jgi:hypothetical protein
MISKLPKKHKQTSLKLPETFCLFFKELMQTSQTSQTSLNSRSNDNSIYAYRISAFIGKLGKLGKFDSIYILFIYISNTYKYSKLPNACGSLGKFVGKFGNSWRFYGRSNRFAGNRNAKLLVVVIMEMEDWLDDLNTNNDDLLENWDE